MAYRAFFLLCGGIGPRSQNERHSWGAGSLTWHGAVSGAAQARARAWPARAVAFNGQTISYVRPNLGSFVDWDGDGKADFIGCHFENSIRLYRNVGSGEPNAEPQFASAEGIVILQSWAPQMISGADATDWNGDGDTDILTGQGHGGSGLRFYERDYLEDEINGTHPSVTIEGIERRDNPLMHL